MSEKNNDVLDLDFVPVSSGSYSRGSADGYACVQPENKTTVSYSFYISSTLITQATYKEIMRSNPSSFAGDNLPVENVSWHEALEFCSRLTNIFHVQGILDLDSFIRLPTESEWELALCDRSGEDELPVAKIPENIEEYAWFKDNSAGKTHPVKEKKPLGRGLYDMLGNVGEWCMDWYSPYESKEYKDCYGPDQGMRKIRRGGSWFSSKLRCNALDRISIPPGMRSSKVGFRPVLIKR